MTQSARNMRKNSNPLLVVLWLAGLGLCWFGMLVYERTPGREPSQAPSWPAKTTIPLSKTGPSLIMFAHPKCPCTRASVAELGKILSTSKTPGLQACIVFFTPKANDKSWIDTDVFARASSLPGVKVLIDEAGKETARFGAVTSGDVRLYDAKGELRFSGGITTQRGHAGENSSAAKLQELLKSNPGEGLAKTPVFGCEILSQCPNKSGTR